VPSRRASTGPRAPAARCARSTPAAHGASNAAGRIPPFGLVADKHYADLLGVRSRSQGCRSWRSKLVPQPPRAGTIGETLVRSEGPCTVYFPVSPASLQTQGRRRESRRWRLVRRQARRNAWPRGRVRVRQEHHGQGHPSTHSPTPRVDFEGTDLTRIKGRECAFRRKMQNDLPGPLCEPDPVCP